VDLPHRNPRPAAGTSANRRRRFRLISAGVVAVVVSGLALLATNPADRFRLAADSATAWLPSVQRGIIGRVNALVPGPGSGTTDYLSIQMGADISPIRRGSVLVIGGGHSEVSVVDLRTLRIDRVPAATTERVEVVDDHVFRIDDGAGRVVAVPNGSTVLDLHGVPAGPSTVSGGALWLAVPDTGSIVRIDRSGAAKTVPGAFSAGRRPFLAALPDGIAVLDLGTGEVAVLVGRSSVRRYRTDLRRAMAAAGADSVSSFQVAADAADAVVLARGGRSTSVVVFGLAGGRRTVVRPLNDTGDLFGAAVLSNDRLYVSNDSAGALTIVRVRPNVSAVSSIGVAHRPSALEVFAKDSLVWANDPNGPAAAAVYADRHWTITKYVSESDTPSVSPSSASPSSTTAPPSRAPSNGAPPTHTSGPVRTGGPPAHPSGIGTGQPPGGHRDTATFTNLHNGSSVKRCQAARIADSLVAGKTLLIAHRRTSPPDGTYYFEYAGPYSDGNVPASFGTVAYFGTAADQRYDLYLLIMDVNDARTFWESHRSSDGSFATSTSIPGTAGIAEKISVTQTDITC
jgi:hypothetical protein